MTIRNMSIEAGARAGMVAPDDTTPRVLAWSSASHPPVPSDHFRPLATASAPTSAPFSITEVYLDAASLSPFVTQAPTQPAGTAGVAVPDPQLMTDDAERRPPRKHWRTWTFDPECDARHRGRRRVRRSNNGRIEDLRVTRSAAWPRGEPTACGCRSFRGSMRVRAGLSAEGSVRSFTDAGAQWRQAGCSMLGMNPGSTAGVRGALRRDVQPQLRRAAGRVAAAHIWCPQQCRPPPRLRGTPSSPADLN